MKGVYNNREVWEQLKQGGLNVDYKTFSDRLQRDPKRRRDIYNLMESSGMDLDFSLDDMDNYFFLPENAGRENRQTNEQALRSAVQGYSTRKEIPGGYEPSADSDYTAIAEKQERLIQIGEELKRSDLSYPEAQQLNHEYRTLEASLKNDYKANAGIQLKQLEELRKSAEGRVAERQKYVAEQDRKHAEEVHQLPLLQRTLYNIEWSRNPNLYTYKDDELDSAKRTLKDIKETEELYKSAVTNRDKAWYEKLWRGLSKTASNADTWTFGASQFKDTSARKKIIDKFNNNPDSLTDYELEELTAMAINTYFNEQYADDVSNWEHIGAGAVESLPFLAEMALWGMATGGAGAAIKAGGKATNTIGGLLVKRFGRDGAKKLTHKILNAGLQVGGDIAQAGLMTATTGLPGTLADANMREMGVAAYGQTPSGEVSYAGQVGGTSKHKAFWDAFTAGTIERESEMIGNYFAPIGNWLGKYADVPVHKTKLSHLVGATARGVRKVSRTRGMEFVKDLAHKVNFNNPMAEFAEELIGGSINAATVGDQTLEEVLSGDNLAVTFGVTVLYSLGFGAVGGGAYGASRTAQRYNVSQAKNALRSREAFGEEVAGKIIGLADNATLENINEAHAEARKLAKSSKDQALIDHFFKSYVIDKGMRIGGLLDVNEKGEQAHNEAVARGEAEGAYERVENPLELLDVKPTQFSHPLSYRFYEDGNPEQVTLEKAQDPQEVAKAEQNAQELITHLHDSGAWTEELETLANRVLAGEVSEQELISYIHSTFGIERNGRTVLEGENARTANLIFNAVISSMYAQSLGVAHEEYLSSEAYQEGVRSEIIDELGGAEALREDGSARTVVQMRGGQSEVTIVRGDIGVKPNEMGGLEIDGKEEDTIYYRDTDGKIKVGTVGEVDRIISHDDVNSLLADRVTEASQMHREAIELAKTATAEQQEPTTEQGVVDTVEAELTEVEVSDTTGEATTKSEQPQQQKQEVGIEIDEATGQKKYENAPIELTVDDIMGQVDGDPSTALLVAETMVANTNKEIEKAKKVKLEGNTPEEIIAHRNKIKTSIAEAEQKRDYWLKVVETLNEAIEYNAESASVATDIPLSNEVDSKGSPFVLSPNGTTTFGENTEEMSEATGGEGSEVSTETQAEPQQQVDERDTIREEVETAIAKLEQEFGVAVVQLNDASELEPRRDADVLRELEAGRTPTAWYRKSENKVYMLMSNVDSAEDVTKTYIHEVVTHFGLRAIMSEAELNELLDTIWDGISDYDKRDIIEQEGIEKSPAELNEREHRRVAEEFLAYRSESEAFMEVQADGRTLWQKIVDFIAELFNRKGVRTENVYELADSVLRQSVEHLRNQKETKSSNTEASTQQYRSIEPTVPLTETSGTAENLGSTAEVTTQETSGNRAESTDVDNSKLNALNAEREKILEKWDGKIKGTQFALYPNKKMKQGRAIKRLSKQSVYFPGSSSNLVRGEKTRCGMIEEAFLAENYSTKEVEPGNYFIGIEGDGGYFITKTEADYFNYLQDGGYPLSLHIIDEQIAKEKQRIQDEIEYKKRREQEKLEREQEKLEREQRIREYRDRMRPKVELFIDDLMDKNVGVIPTKDVFKNSNNANLDLIIKRVGDYLLVKRIRIYNDGEYDFDHYWFDLFSVYNSVDSFGYKPVSKSEANSELSFAEAFAKKYDLELKPSRNKFKLSDTPLSEQAEAPKGGSNAKVTPKKERGGYKYNLKRSRQGDLKTVAKWYNMLKPGLIGAVNGIEGYIVDTNGYSMIITPLSEPTKERYAENPLTGEKLYNQGIPDFKVVFNRYLFDEVWQISFYIRELYDTLKDGIKNSESPEEAFIQFNLSDGQVVCISATEMAGLLEILYARGEDTVTFEGDPLTARSKPFRFKAGKYSGLQMPALFHPDDPLPSMATYEVELKPRSEAVILFDFLGEVAKEGQVEAPNKEAGESIADYAKRVDEHNSNNNDVRFKFGDNEETNKLNRKQKSVDGGTREVVTLSEVEAYRSADESTDSKTYTTATGWRVIELTGNEAKARIDDILLTKEGTSLPAPIASLEEFVDQFSSPIETPYEVVEVNNAKSIWEKLISQGREQLSGTVLEVLKTPDFFIQESNAIIYAKSYKVGAERNSYIVSIRKEDSSGTYIASVHRKSTTNLKNKITDGVVLTEVLQKESTHSDRPSNIDAEVTTTPSALGKGTEIGGENQNNDVLFRRSSTEAYNERFNEALKRLTAGELPNGYVFKLGRPSEALLAGGVWDNEMELSADRLYRKSRQENHPFDLADLTDLPLALNSPIAVFNSTKGKVSKVVLIEIKSDDNNFVVVLRVRRGDKYAPMQIVVTSIVSLYPKDYVEGVLDWINGGLMTWVDKEKASDYLYAQRAFPFADGGISQKLSLATKVVENFKNPKLKGEGSETLTDEQSEADVRFRHLSEEKREIKKRAIADGTFMKAPNGKPTNLTERQWLAVRTESFKRWFGDWEKSLQADYLLSDNYVSELIGNEFAKSESPITEMVAKYYADKYEGSVERAGIGIVELNERSVKDSIAHGLGRNKAVAFASVPEVIKKGAIIDRQENWKGRGYNSYTIAAPISINGDGYVCVVIVNEIKDKGSNRFYIHEVALQKNLQTEEFKTGMNTGSPAGDIANILRAVVNAKDNSSKVVDENGEPMVVYHGTSSEFNTFNVGLGRRSMDVQGIYLTPYKEEASSYSGGGRVMELYVSLKNPSVNPTITGLGTTDTAGILAREQLQKKNHDGIIYIEYGVVSEVVAFDSNNVKSAAYNVGTFDSSNDDIRFRIGNKRKADMRRGLMNKLTNATEEQIENTITEVEKLGEHVKEGGDSKTEKVALHWVMKGTVILPEDTYKVTQAIDLSTANKVDPMRYNNPMDIINRYKKGVEYGSEVSPVDFIEVFTDRREVLPDDGSSPVVIYDVEDSEAGQEAVCEICHHHFGFRLEGDRQGSLQPWCLASYTRKGKPTESAWRYWHDVYNSVGKKIAFQDGNPIAFMAHNQSYDGDLWWSLSDAPSNNLPLPNGTYLMNDGTVEDYPRKAEEDDIYLYWDEAAVNVANNDILDYQWEDIVTTLYWHIIENKNSSGAYSESTFKRISDYVNEHVYDRAVDLITSEFYDYDIIKDRWVRHLISYIETDGDLDEDIDLYGLSVFELEGVVDSLTSLEAQKDDFIDELARNFSSYDEFYDDWVDLLDEAIQEETTSYNYSDNEVANIIRDVTSYATNDKDSPFHYSINPSSINGSVYEEARRLSLEYYNDNNDILFRRSSTEAYNEQFNKDLKRFSEETANNIRFNLGYPSLILLSAGVKNKPMILYGNKLLAKVRKHGFYPEELMNLPMYTKNPIAVFDTLGDGSRSILTEIGVKDGNILVAVSVGKGMDIDLNIIRSTYGKKYYSIVSWILNNKATYINREKALAYLQRHPTPIVGTSEEAELSLATKVVENFKNPKLKGEGSETLTDEQSEADVRFRHAEARYGGLPEYESGEPLGRYAERVLDSYRERGTYWDNPTPKPKRPEYRGQSIAEWAREMDDYSNDPDVLFRTIDYEMPEAPQLESGMSIAEMAKLTDEYNRRKRAISERVKKDLKRVSNLYVWLVDRAEPLRVFLRAMEREGVPVSAEVNAYIDFMRSNGMSQTVLNKATIEVTRPLERELREHTKLLMGSGFIGGLELTFWDKDTGDVLAVEQVDAFRAEGLYLQALDIIESEAIGWVSRGRKGFTESTTKDGKNLSPEEYIKMYEEAVGEERAKALQVRAKRHTDYTLNILYRGGFLTKEDYAKYAERKHYTPQRSWEKRSVIEKGVDYVLGKPSMALSDFVDRADSGTYVAALARAEGRESLGANPLPYMVNMQRSAIASVAKNNTKQAFLKWVEQNMNQLSDIGAVSLQEVYYVRKMDPITGEVVRNEQGRVVYQRTATPPTRAMIEADLKTREEMKRIGDELLFLERNYRQEKIEVEDYAKRREALEEQLQTLEDSNNVLYTAKEGVTEDVLTDKERQALSVHVMRDGKQYELTLNSTYRGADVANVLNRKFADAVANLTGARYVGRVTRAISSLLTQYNPAFAPVNFIRDFGFASLGNISKYGIAYQARFGKNLARSASVVAQYVYKSEKGKAEIDGKEGSMERYLKEFFEDGAQTGWNYLPSLRDTERQMKRATGSSRTSQLARGYDSASEAVKFALGGLTELSELWVRFATYVTSRETMTAEGRHRWTREETAMNAKEVSTNFDRKGTITGVFGMLYSFFNATVQGTNNLAMIAKQAPKAFSASVAMMMAGGLLQALFTPEGDDDDEELQDWSEWDLMTNIVVGDVKVPLPHGFRSFWGFSTQLGLYMRGKKGLEEAVYDGLDYFFANLLPEQISGFVSGAFDYDEYRRTIGADGRLMLNAAMPTSLAPFIEVATNRNFMGQPITRETYISSKEEMVPRSSQGKGQTNDFFEAVSRFLFEEVGGGVYGANTKMKRDGSGYVDWGFDISPSDMQHIVEGYGGGVLRMVVNTANVITRMIEQDKEGKEQVVHLQDSQILRPFLRRRTGDYSKSDRVMFEVARIDRLMKEEVDEALKTPEMKQHIYEPMVQGRGLTVPELRAWVMNNGTLLQKYFWLQRDTERLKKYYDSGQADGEQVLSVGRDLVQAFKTM